MQHFHSLDSEGVGVESSHTPVSQSSRSHSNAGGAALRAASLFFSVRRREFCALFQEASTTLCAVIQGRRRRSCCQPANARHTRAPPNRPVSERPTPQAHTLTRPHAALSYLDANLFCCSDEKARFRTDSTANETAQRSTEETHPRFRWGCQPKRFNAFKGPCCRALCRSLLDRRPALHLVTAPALSCLLNPGRFV